MQDAGEPRPGQHRQERSAGDRAARGRARAIALGTVRGASATHLRGSRQRLAGLAESLAAALALEVADRRFFLFLPLAFAAGIALYFGAPAEPWSFAALLPALALGGLALLARERPFAFHLLALLATLAAGFATASLQVHRIAHPVLERAVNGVAISGYVEAAEQRARGSRITLYLTSFGRADVTAPLRARVTLASRAPPAVGTHVTLRASLAPPPGPAYPGGFDFGRMAWFEGIGATGFALGKVVPAPSTAPPPAGLAASAWLAATRAAIATRIRAALETEGASPQQAADAAIAVALVTGLRDGVPEDIEESMRVSGLSHVLSISGLHMALVATGMFFLVRALLALIPGASLRWPIKNWAALPAALAATFYLVLSGAEVATQRAYLMTLIVLAGVALDRPALTLRTLAVAALVVLALTPWAVLDPGAQMSFAATLALVAAYARWGRQVAEVPGARLRWLHRPAIYLAALVLTSLAAGLATAPFAAYHFHRLAPMSLLANLGAMPIVSLVIMPAALTGALLIPFGWDEPAWQVMGWGIGVMVEISRAVASVPGADRGLVALPLATLICFALALALLCLLRSRFILVAPVLALAGLAFLPFRERPDILVDREGRTVAVRQKDGALALMGDRDHGLGARFVVEQWLGAEGARDADEPTLMRAAHCDPLGCTLRDAGGAVIALPRNRAALEEDCRRAALLITIHTPPTGCAAQVLRIDPDRQTSGLALYRAAVAWSGRSPEQDRPLPDVRARDWDEPTEADDLATGVSPEADEPPGGNGPPEAPEQQETPQPAVTPGPAAMPGPHDAADDQHRAQRRDPAPPRDTHGLGARTGLLAPTSPPNSQAAPDPARRQGPPTLRDSHPFAPPTAPVASPPIAPGAAASIASASAPLALRGAVAPPPRWHVVDSRPNGGRPWLPPGRAATNERDLPPIGLAPPSPPAHSKRQPDPANADRRSTEARPADAANAPPRERPSRGTSPERASGPPQ